MSLGQNMMATILGKEGSQKLNAGFHENCQDVIFCFFVRFRVVCLVLVRDLAGNFLQIWIQWGPENIKS